LDWLAADLARARSPVILFIHQLLSGVDSHRVKNAEQVRAILESSGKVAAVLQGHKHKGAFDRIEGIYYYALKAVVEGSGPENNSYAIVDILPNADIIITGYRRAESHRIAQPPIDSAFS
jgi:alkaline phosphatase